MELSNFVERKVYDNEYGICVYIIVVVQIL